MKKFIFSGKVSLLRNYSAMSLALRAAGVSHPFVLRQIRRSAHRDCEYAASCVLFQNLLFVDADLISGSIVRLLLEYCDDGVFSLAIKPK